MTSMGRAEKRIEELQQNLNNFSQSLNREHSENLGIYSDSHVNQLIQKAYFGFEV